MAISRETYQDERRRLLARLFAARSGVIIAELGSFIPSFPTTDHRAQYMAGLIDGYQSRLQDLRYAYYRGVD